MRDSGILHNDLNIAPGSENRETVKELRIRKKERI
jgi:hypothetical protein